MATGSVDSRDALCHALVRVVSECGWAGASTARVAREAGLAPHEFYDHFRSLEDCFVRVHDQMMVRLVRASSRAIASHPLGLGRTAWQTQLEAAIGAALLFFSVEPALARTCLVEVLAAGPRARTRRERALASFASYVEGLRLSHGGPMPPLAAEMIVLGTNDIVQRRVARGEAERLPDLLPQLRQLWLASVAEHVDHPQPDPALAAPTPAARLAG